MDEGPISHPGVPGEKYHTLGGKTLWLFALARIHSAVILLLVAAGLFAIKDEPFLATIKGVGDVQGYVALAGSVTLVLFAVVFVLTFFIAWLIYINYKFSLAEDALKIKRGILNKEEVAIPYRQIQDVNIRRDLAFQMIGLSRVIILTAGEEDEIKGDSESEGILPALDKNLAEWLQAELLKRANIQKVVETKPVADASPR